MPAKRVGLQPYTEKSLTPFSYGLGSIKLTNHEGKVADIQDIVTEFTVTESLYGSGLILRLDIKDSANFFEEYKLIGQEKVELTVFRQAFFEADRTEVKVEFYVSEYPLYGKTQQLNTHIYSIVALTPHVYLSKLKKISRPLSKESSLEIKNILASDLNVTRLGTFETTQTKIDGVIPWSHPLDAAYWIAQNSYGQKGSPFFLYETFKDGLQFRSYSSLVGGAVYRRLLDSRQYSAKPETQEDYIEKQNRILSIASEFRVSKLIPAVKGAWSNKAAYVNAFEKKISTESFSYQKDTAKTNLTLEGKALLSSKFKVSSGKGRGEYSLDNVTDVGTSYFASDTSVPKNYVGVMQSRNYLIANSVNECVDNCVHTVTVAGDFSLSAGKIVELRIPKAIDFSAYDKTGWSDDDLYDSLLSGKYLITSVIHKFNEEYRCVLTVKKDSLKFYL